MNIKAKNNPNHETMAKIPFKLNVDFKVILKDTVTLNVEVRANTATAMTVLCIAAKSSI